MPSLTIAVEPAALLFQSVASADAGVLKSFRPIGARAPGFVKAPFSLVRRSVETEPLILLH